MNNLVVAAVVLLIGLAIIVYSLVMFLLTYGHGGTSWLYPLSFGVLVAVSAFLYLGSKARNSP